MSDADLVLYETEGGVSIVTLNRPDKLNALTVPFRDRALEVFNQADEDPDTRVVLLRGAAAAPSASATTSAARIRKRPSGATTR